MTILWPRKLLPPQNPMFHVSPMNVSGPLSQDGQGDVIAGDAGFWKVTFGSVVVTTTDRVKTWRAIAAMLQGRLEPILVPYCGAYQPRLTAPVDVPHSDGTPFSDGTKYEGMSTAVYLVGDLVRGVTNCVVNVVAAGEIQPGHVFSFGERMYEIRRIVDNTFYFNPPLRDPVSSGTQLNFDNPVCRMRLASDNEMQLQLEGNRRSFPNVNFVEDLL